MKSILIFLGGVLLSLSGNMQGIGYNKVLCIILSTTGWILLNVAVKGGN